MPPASVTAADPAAAETLEAAGACTFDDAGILVPADLFRLHRACVEQDHVVFDDGGDDPADHGGYGGGRGLSGLVAKIQKSLPDRSATFLTGFFRCF